MNKLKMTDAVKSIFDKWIEKKVKDDEAFFEFQVYEFYDEMLDEVYGEASIGWIKTSTSYAMKNTDEISYEQGFLEYVDNNYERVSDVFDIDIIHDYYYPKDELIDDFLEEGCLNIIDIREDYNLIVEPNDEWSCPVCGSKL